MDRFTEESAADLERNFRLSRQAEPKPFFAIAEPCERCGRPLDGAECPCGDDIETPAEPRCPVEYELILQAEAVAKLNYQVKLHRLTCPVCQRTRKEARREPGRTTWEKAA
jgi:hypothetical protein